MRPILSTASRHGNTDFTYQKALTAAYAAEDRKGDDIKLIDVRDVSSLADYFLIVTGYSSTQIQAISRVIQENMEEEWHILPQRIEGQDEASWILLDYADIIIHVMRKDERD